MEGKTNIRNYLLPILFALQAVGLPIICHAQNNPYKIKDELYAIYREGEKNRLHPHLFALVDSLYREAVRLDDKKAQCLAYTLPIKHYFSKNDPVHLAEAKEKLKEIARKNGYLQYYYYGWNQYIILLQNRGMHISALDECAKMHKQALADNHPFGIFSCLRNMGHLQSSRSNSSQAYKYYKQALDYLLKHMPEQDPAQLYYVLSEYHRTKTQQFDSAMYYCELGIRSARTEQPQAICKIQKALNLHSADRQEEFNAYVPEALEAAHKAGLPDNNINLILLRTRIAINEGDQAKAYRYVNMLTNQGDICRQLFTVDRAFGNYESAIKNLERHFNICDSVRCQLQNNDIAYFNAQFGNEQLLRENTKLDLQNTQLQLEQVRQQLAIDRQEAENQQLMLDKQSLELEQLRTESDLQKSIAARQQAELQRQESINAEHQSRAHYQRLIGICIITLLAASVAFLIFYQYRRRKNLLLLQRKNEELTKANERVHKANKMKDLFIQNMSHEIRTPLNSIVGFTQLITDPGMQFSPEETQEFSRLITSNSELLTTLVNDILSLAELESSDIQTKLQPCRCNDICQKAIATVSHRLPQGVVLRFTTDVTDDYTLYSDENRISQVLINYLTNAEKHTTQGEIHLHVSLQEHPGYLTFSVTDTGCGIPPEAADKVFDRFFKVDSFHQGTGLGLSICQLIAERMHATVKLDTAYTQGARFLFILPLTGGESHTA